MKKTILFLITIFLLSCSNNTSDKSQEKKICFECDSYGKGVYEGVGCMTEEVWNQYSPIDMRPENLGNNLDKSKYCRKQKLPE